MIYTTRELQFADLSTRRKTILVTSKIGTSYFTEFLWSFVEQLKPTKAGDSYWTLKVYSTYKI